MKIISLAVVMSLIFTNLAFGGAKRVVTSTYTCPPEKNLTYSVNYNNAGKGGDGYQYYSNDKKDSGILPEFVKAWAEGKKGSKFMIKCEYKTVKKNLIYTLKTSQHKLDEEASKCKSSGRNVTCQTYK